MRKLHLITLCIMLLSVVSAWAQRIEGRVFDKKTDVSVHKSEVSFLNEKGTEIYKMETSKDGQFSYKGQNLGDVHTIVCKTKGYHDADFMMKPFKDMIVVNFGLIAGNDTSGVQYSVQYSVDNIANSSLLGAKPKERKNVGEDLPYFYYDFNSSYLNEDNKDVVDKVVSFMENNSSKKVQVTVFVETRNNVKYNEWLAERRAQRVKDYLILQGIDQSRIEQQIERVSKDVKPRDGNVKKGDEIRRCDFYIL